MRFPRRLLAAALAAAAAAATATGCDAASADAGAVATAAPPTSAVAMPGADAGADSLRDALIARADLGRIAGRDSAPVWIVVISDFQCPFCKRWHEETQPRIEANYVRSGKARIAYINLPISTHRNAQPAHEAAMCAAEQGAFWPVADALFASQDRWKSTLNVEPFFDSLATRHVGDAARFRSCIRDGHTRALIATDVSRVTRMGVGSTPSFLIGNRMLVGAQPYEAFATAIDAALAGTRR
jgi:protein-disulfide isomerase